MPIITGNTKIENCTLDGQRLSFKREDLNPSGSFKDRLIAFIWPQLLQLNGQEIAVSSSGNLAISLLYFQKHADEKLTSKLKIFIKDNLPENKYLRLSELVKKADAELIISAKPKSDCFKYAKENNAFWLRNSIGADYPQAYHRLAEEIVSAETEGTEFDSVFIATSSGTAALGLLEGLNKRQNKLTVVVVQTSHIHSIAKEFDSDFVPETSTAANAISDRVAARKAALLAELKTNGGTGVVVGNTEIQYATSSLESLFGKGFTGNAALSLAGFFKSQKKGYNFNNPLIIISGN